MAPATQSRLRLIALLLITTAALSACTPAIPVPGETTTHTDPSKPFNGTRPADTVLNDFAKIMDDTIKHSGTTFPTWKGKDTDGILLDSCQVGPNDGNKFAINIKGGPIKDPKTAANTMKTHWETLGYTIGNIFDDTDRPVPGMQISATTPNGAFIEFSPGATTSYINVKSECTLDPSLNQ